MLRNAYPKRFPELLLRWGLRALLPSLIPGSWRRTLCREGRMFMLREKSKAFLIMLKPVLGGWR